MRRQTAGRARQRFARTDASVHCPSARLHPWTDRATRWPSSTCQLHVVEHVRLVVEAVALAPRQRLKSRERSRAWIVNKLVNEAAQKQIEFDDFVQIGLDDLAAGRVHTQEEMEQWFEARKANRASRIAAE